MTFIFAAIVGYLIGSVPFGLVLTKFAGLGDIRAIGSGNIGATNVLRTGNKKLALATLILDGAKGAVAVMLARWMLTFDATMIAGVAAVIGHIFPVWLKFKGGKGVATTLGTLIALLPSLGLSACMLWLITAFFTRISSLSALVAIGLSPFIAWVLTRDFSSNYTEADGSQVFLLNHHLNWMPLVCAVLAVIVFYKHKENIQRILKNTEPKIGQKK